MSKNIQYNAHNFSVNISLDRVEKNIEFGQWWLGHRVLEACRASMPLKTGSLQQRSHIEENGRKVVFPGPYARYLYYGKVMVDPVTGSPWARRGAKKVLTDRPLKFSNPQATDHWFDRVKSRYMDAWLTKLKQILGGYNG